MKLHNNLQITLSQSQYLARNTIYSCVEQSEYLVNQNWIERDFIPVVCVVVLSTCGDAGAAAAEGRQSTDHQGSQGLSTGHALTGVDQSQVGLSWLVDDHQRFTTLSSTSTETTNSQLVLNTRWTLSFACDQRSLSTSRLVLAVVDCE